MLPLYIPLYIATIRVSYIYRGHIYKDNGKEMETTIVCRVIGIMEKKMETSIRSCLFQLTVNFNRRYRWVSMFEVW